MTFIESLDEPPVDTHDVYLRLHLLSTRKVRPNERQLDGIFGLLNNVVWTNLGPCDPRLRSFAPAAGGRPRLHGAAASTSSPA